MKVFLFLVSALCFWGCIDIRIKSEIPKKSYYDLDTMDLGSKSCPAFKRVGFSGVGILASVDNQNIVSKTKEGKIEFVPGVFWVDNPREMIKNLFIKSAYASCISLESGSIQRMDKHLLVNVLFLGYLDGFSLVELSYQIFNQKFESLKMGVIQKRDPSEGIPALQKIVKESIDEILLEVK